MRAPMVVLGVSVIGSMLATGLAHVPAEAQERSRESRLGIPRLTVEVSELRVTDADLARWARLPRRVRPDAEERVVEPPRHRDPRAALAPPPASHDAAGKPVLPPPGDQWQLEEHVAAQTRRHTVVSWD